MEELPPRRRWLSKTELAIADAAVTKAVEEIKPVLAAEIKRVVKETAAPLLTHINKHATLRGRVIALEPGCSYCKKFFADLLPAKQPPPLTTSCSQA